MDGRNYLTQNKPNGDQQIYNKIERMKDAWLNGCIDKRMDELMNWKINYEWIDKPMG